MYHTLKVKLQSVWQGATTEDPPVRQTLPPGDLGPVGGCQRWSVQLALTHHFIRSLIKRFEAPVHSAAC